MLIETTGSDARRDDAFGDAAWFRATGSATIQFDAPLDLEAYYEEWARFFASPRKERYRAAPGMLGGYFPFSSERALGAIEADPKEFFHVLEGVILPDELRDTTKALFRCLALAARHVLCEVARIEPTAGGIVSALTDTSRMILRVTRYHAAPSEADDAAAAHTDVDLLTLLPPATEAGLLILDPTGHWTPLSPGKHQAAVLAGDMLEHATRGAIKAARHRVANHGLERFSLSFFANPPDETALGDCLSAGELVAAKLSAMRVG